MEFITKVSIEGKTPLVYGAFNENIDIHPNLNDYLNDLKNDGLLDLSLGAVNKIYPFDKLENKALFIIGLGDKNNYDYEKLEKAGSKITKKLNKELIVVLDSFCHNLNKEEVLKKLILTTLSYNYHYDETKSKKTQDDFSLGFYFTENLHHVIEEYVNLGMAINNTRDLINKPYNYLNTNDLVNYAQELVNTLKNDSVEIEVLNKEKSKN